MPLTTSTLLDRFRSQLLSFSSEHKIQRWVVALSGGLDSCVLLHLVADSDTALPVKVVHVHHGLSDNANEWMLFCQRLSTQYGYEYKGQKVQLAEGSLEEQARIARYQVFEDTLVAGDALLLAHHMNDQAETFLQRIIRGAGLSGLASIPVCRDIGSGILFRPLLKETRDELEVYASKNQLRWVEDESNVCDRFDRNYLRHKVMPLLQSRWPTLLGGVSRTQANISEEASALDFYRKHWLAQHDSLDRFNIDSLALLPSSEVLGILSAWIKRHMQYSITTEQLKSLYHNVVLAKQDAEPLMDIGVFEIRRYKNHLHCVEKVSVNYQQFHAELDLSGKTSLLLALPDGSRLSLQSDPNGYVFESTCLTVSYRQGGEKIKPVGDAHTRDLKKWFQANNIPSWKRAKIPLLYCNQKLVAVADLCVDNSCVEASHSSSEISDNCWRIEWLNQPNQ